MNQDKDIDNKPASETRRKLVRGGLSAGPILVTLTSRPVLATTCYSPSETLSGAVSHKGTSMPTCTGHSVTTWRSAANTSWPASPKHNTLFTAYFTGATFYYDHANNRYMKMKEVLHLGSGSDPDEIGAYFITALLNIQSGLVDSRALDAPGLQAMWHEFITTTKYVPFGGATPWTAADIKLYFTSTGIVG